jgi:Gram-negative bacterial TonB protein C-terminal
MQKRFIAVVVAAAMVWPASMNAEDITARVKKAVERNTLDQPGMKPFHLKAILAPSFDRDKASGRSGEVEIWWVGPDKWRREVRSPKFHQIEIVNGGKVWQKNDGDYFPEWLRETAVALVKPVPDLDKLLKYAKAGEEKTLMGQTHVSWVEMGSDGTVSKGIGAGIYLGANGISFASGLGYDAGLEEVADFHGRSIAHKVTSGGGGAEVTARVTVLEDLKDATPQLFDSGPNASDPILETRLVDEVAERENLLPEDVAGWPPLEQGPLEGVLIAKVVIDREGKIRDVGGVLSDNPGLNDAARERIVSMRFKPFLLDGVPVQVVTTMTMPFKTTRPAGAETFETARTYFERGRKVGFLAAGTRQAYVLRAEFKTRGSSGTLETGTYTDTWISDRQWRREAVLGSSRVVRSRNGDKRYLIADGPDAALLRIVLIDMEPIPAIDTFVESDWRIKRDTLDGIATIRVARGYESPDGTPDAKQFNGYWFDKTGQLVKTYWNGLETRRANFGDFDGATVARRVDVFSGGKLGMRIDITDLSPAGTLDPGIFVLKGHDWVRQFTAEVR